MRKRQVRGESKSESKGKEKKDIKSKSKSKSKSEEKTKEKAKEKRNKKGEDKKKTVKKFIKKTLVKKKTGDTDALKKIISLIEDKKAEDIKVFDVREISGLWDYFILCTGTSSVHIRSIYENMEKEMKKSGSGAGYKDIGLDNKWIIADYGDMLVHIFDRETRLYYSIEKLWGEKEINLRNTKSQRGV